MNRDSKDRTPEAPSFGRKHFHTCFPADGGQFGHFYEPSRSAKQIGSFRVFNSSDFWSDFHCPATLCNCKGY